MGQEGSWNGLLPDLNKNKLIYSPKLKPPELLQRITAKVHVTNSIIAGCAKVFVNLEYSPFEITDKKYIEYIIQLLKSNIFGISDNFISAHRIFGILKK